jgi:hypothetical protein
MSVAVVFRVVYDSFSEITLLFLVNTECRSGINRGHSIERWK